MQPSGTRLAAMRGSPAMTRMPAKASTMPAARRQPSRSPRKIHASSAANGTWSWIATDATEASTWRMPTNIRPKCRAPIEIESPRIFSM